MESSGYKCGMRLKDTAADKVLRRGDRGIVVDVSRLC